MRVRHPVRGITRRPVRGTVGGGGGPAGFRILSFSVAANGTTCTIVFSEAATQGTGFDIASLTGNTSSTGAKDYTYTSGDGTDTWVVEADEEMGALESGTVSWAGTADGIENGDGDDLPSQTKPINNGSEVFFSNDLIDDSSNILIDDSGNILVAA